MSDAIAQLKEDLADIPKAPEYQVRSWLVSKLKTFSEMPESLASRIVEGVTASNLGAAAVPVVCNGATGDDDTNDRTRYSVNCLVMVLFDWKAFTIDEFKAAASIVSRAIRSTDFLTMAIQDTLDGTDTFYWLSTTTDKDTDVVNMDSEFWDGATGRTYNHASFRFNLFFSKSNKLPATHTLITQGESA